MHSDRIVKWRRAFKNSTHSNKLYDPFQMQIQRKSQPKAEIKIYTE